MHPRVFFFNDTATTEIYTLSLHDALPICILIHQPSSGFEGQSTDIEIHAREILKTRKRVDEIYAKHTGQSEERVHADMERDRFFKADQAVEYGLRSEEHTSELQSRQYLVCRLLLEKKKYKPHT